MSKGLWLTLPLLVLAGCSTVTINPQGSERITSAPTYEQRLPYYFWGLSGEHFINVDEICGNGNTQQMQSQFTFEDGVLNVVTLGIYQPRTAKVWCAKENVL